MVIDKRWRLNNRSQHRRQMPARPAPEGVAKEHHNQSSARGAEGITAGAPPSNR
jgi:hypothetical protein